MSEIVREAAFAGHFYNDDPKVLRREIENYMLKSLSVNCEKDVRALIVPHAGYIYSGEVAAAAYAQLCSNKKWNNIFLIGSSHHISFNGVSAFEGDYYETPFGRIHVNRAIVNELYTNNDNLFVHQPEAHKNEHTLEVQLPFLKYQLKEEFNIVPIILGTYHVDHCKALAVALDHYWCDENLFIVSTDFSHYPNYQSANVLDKKLASIIEHNNPMELLNELDETVHMRIDNLATRLCGWTSVLALQFLTSGKNDLSYELIRYKNSGDASIGDKERVVGYCAMGVYNNQDKKRFRLTNWDKETLLQIARNSIEDMLEKGNWQVPDHMNSSISREVGAFVSLYVKDELRGCIGTFSESEPLYKVVRRMAIAAASEDTRFSPIEQGELETMHIEISVLTPRKLIHSIDEITLGQHGIYIKKEMNSGTFLPQVATKTGWSLEEFLGHCARDKAHIGWDGWKDAEIFCFEAIVFKSTDFMV